MGNSGGADGSRGITITPDRAAGEVPETKAKPSHSLGPSDYHKKVRTLDTCLGGWELLTSDQWILETVSGYTIEFTSELFQNFVPNEINFSTSEKIIISNEISELSKKGAIKAVDPANGELISTIIVVPKKNGKFRPVINLRYLNRFVEYQHFKQENLNIVLDLIQKDDFLTSIGLQDAYFSIPIQPRYHKYLRFSWQDQLYQFLVLPFGLSSAPRLFTKILKAVYACLRQKRIRCEY